MSSHVVASHCKGWSMRRVQRAPPVLRYQRRRCAVPLPSQQAPTTSKSIVLNALLGSDVRPRGSALWSQLHLLSSQAVRDDPCHVLNNANSSVRSVLMDALNERQPFHASERRLLVQRSQTASSTTHDVELSIPTKADLSSAPVAQWYTLGVHQLSQRMRSTTSQRWDDILFPLLQHPVFYTSDMKQLAAALNVITSLVEWQVERMLELEAEHPHDVSPPTRAFISPRWARKLRKMLCESGARGSIMVFAQWLPRAWEAEERCGHPTMLTTDMELLQFLVTIPCRKDSGLLRQDIAQETATLMRFSCAKLWSIATDGRAQEASRANPMEAVERCLTQASNAIVFAQNDGMESDRLRRVFVTNAVHAVSFGSDVVAAELAHAVLHAALGSIRRKCAALQYTTARSYATVAVEISAAQGWIEEQVSARGVPNVVLADLESMLEALPSQLALAATTPPLKCVVRHVESFISEMAASLRTPLVFERLVDDVVGVVDPWLSTNGLSCAGLRSFVAAAGTNAPKGSRWASRYDAMESEATWKCGCGEAVLTSTASCPSCTFQSSVSFASYQCPRCRSSCASGQLTCGACDEEHPIVKASQGSGDWHCQGCRVVMPVTADGCSACATPNPIQAAVCGGCQHRNSLAVQCCAQCGTRLGATPQSHPVLIQWCSGCSTPMEVPGLHGNGAATMCGRCKQGLHTSQHAAPLAVVQTRRTKWQCGCGTWNSPMGRRCRTCFPLAARDGARVTAKLYECPTCQTHCHQHNINIAQVGIVPHLPNGPMMKAASCGTCGTWHPRDAGLLTTPRLSSCPSCDMPLGYNDTHTVPAECAHCKHRLDARVVQAMAFVDLPWVCHACSHANSNLLDATDCQGGVSFCSHCHVERPSPLLFSPNVHWTCATCNDPTARGYACSTCGTANPHLPKSEIMPWQCVAAECGGWSQSWEAACRHCAAPQPSDAPRTMALDWACPACKAPNGTLMASCWSCGNDAPSVDKPVVDPEDSVCHTRAVLLRAATESASSPSHISLAAVGPIEGLPVGDLTVAGVTDEDLSGVDEILSHMHYL